MNAPCPECGAAVEVPKDALAGELLECDRCGVELELLSTEPPALALFEEEEK
jgi:alpha-aminoadipate carrier protein LysW